MEEVRLPFVLHMYELGNFEAWCQTEEVNPSTIITVDLVGVVEDTVVRFKRGSVIHDTILYWDGLDIVFNKVFESENYVYYMEER